MQNPVLLAVLLAAAACGAAAERILAVFPSSSPSQVNVFTALTKELARRGHQVTVLSPFPQKAAPPGYIDFDLMHGPVAEFKNSLANEGPVLYSPEPRHFFHTALHLWRVSVGLTHAVMTSPQVKDVMKNKGGYDLVIAEHFLHEALHGLAWYFEVPLVLFAPSDLVPLPSGVAPLSYVPHPLLALNKPMSFTDRLVNVLANAFWTLGYNYYYLPQQDAISKEVFGNEAPSVWETEPWLVLLNSDPALNGPVPRMPWEVEVGGLHVRSTPWPLPDELQAFLDGADAGLIYFSFGSSLRCSQMPPALRQVFVDAFRALPQRVVWVYDEDELQGKPENVFIAKWVHQQEVLAHPNTVAMITHGGPVSGQEAAHFGVPVVAIPVFGDQRIRAQRTQRDNLGVMLEMRNVTTPSLLWALKEVTTNPRIKEASVQRRVAGAETGAALEKAVFWVEWVLRRRGDGRGDAWSAPRLRFWQRHSLDVVGAALLGPAAAIFLLVVVVLRK
ncbi:UDP-glucosyltransferase 2-like [Cloeon dipterum]|uniref:UDP-glucosyltransferase 2-like n=1 Tax=Cloeon dipterum TaxID=197152 RepID=UPI00322024A7